MDFAAVNRFRRTPGEGGRIFNLFMLLGVTLILGWLLAALKFVFLPMLLAAFITFLLNPLVNLLQRFRVPRPLGILLSLALALCAAWLAINYVASSFAAFHDGFPKYEQRIQELVSQARAFRANTDFLSAERLQEIFNRISISSVLGSTFNSFFSMLSYMVITMLFVLYFLPSFPNMPDKIKRAFPGQKGFLLCKAVENIAKQVQNYIVAKSFTSIVTGVGVTLPCLFFGVDLALTWGVFATFLNFIPSIGAVLSCLPPLLICALQYDLAQTMWLAVCLGVVMIGTGNFLEPKILGRSVNLSPIAALVALFFWGWLWGAVGMLIAVPATAMIKFTCDHIEGLKPVGVFLGN